MTPDAARGAPRDELLGLPFDLYERYALTRRLIPHLWEGRGRLRVLDVGGHSSPMKQFLPEHRVILSDIAPPGSLTSLPLRFDGYVQATGSSLPFPDNTFDLVAAHDTLEHIPPDLRVPFVHEVLRVSRGFVVLNQPVHHPDTEAAEERLLAYLRKLRPEENRFLKEHAELGLPKTEDIEATLRESGVEFVSIPNGNLSLWVTVNTVKNYVLSLPNAGRAAEQIDRTFNSMLAHRDHGGLCYRRAYVVAVGASGAPRLAPAAESVLAGAQARQPTEGLHAVESLMEGLQEHGAAVKELLRSYHEMSTRLRQDVLDRDARIAEQESTIDNQTAVLAGKAEQVKEKDRAIAARDQEVADRDAMIAAYESSVGLQAVRRFRRGVDRIAPPGTRRRGSVAVMRQGLGALARDGFLAFLRWLLTPWRWVAQLFRAPPIPVRVPDGLSTEWADEPYQRWLRANALGPERIQELREEGERLEYRPLISVVMPVYNSDPVWLQEAVDSVRAQVYGNWELCIADDGSTKEGTRKLVRRLRRMDRRIRVTFLKGNRGIAAASNAALGKAKGTFVGLLDHDDLLQQDALLEVVRALNDRRDLDYVYTDEDKLDQEGRRLEPFFKPDWSPDLLLSVNYVTHFSVFRKELVDRLGGFREGFEGSQDYDLVLRVTEQTDAIGHIRKPLYSWRKSAGSAAQSDEAKPYAYESAKRALREALQRRELDGTVEDGSFRGYYQVRYAIRGAPRVQVVIPTRDRLDMLRRCIESITERSTYPSYEILVIDNDSREPETLAYLDGLDSRVIRSAEPFNFSRLMNLASRNTDADYLLLLNNDTEVIAEDWIEALVEHGQRPEVAAVGARLLFPDGTPQHEGVLVGPGDGLAGNIDTQGYLGLGLTVRNCSAVTAACMLTPAEIYRELGGFEEQLGVAYQDVDYCLRAREKGYLVVYTPYATLFHHEGGTRGRTTPSGGRAHPTENEEFFRERWQGFRDPYYNPNLDIDRPYELALETVGQ